MTAGLLLDGVLALAVLIAAVAALRLRGGFAAVVAFVGYGLLLALVWVRMDAPDVAMTEAAIGGGVTGVLLIGAAARLGPTGAEAPAGPVLRMVVGMACAAVTALLAAALLWLPDPAPSQATTAAAGLPGLGLGNPVTGVLMAYRAFDTLMEKIVLGVALVGVWSLAADDAWGGRLGAAQPLAGGATGLAAQLLPPIGIVLGVYLVLVGADAPGGAFQGGTVLAAMWILAWLAGRTQAPAVASLRMRVLVVAGPVLFIATGLAGMVWADGFLSYPAGWAKPIILAIEPALTLSIAAALALLVAGWPRRGGGS